MKIITSLLALTFAASLTAQEPEMPQPGPEHKKLAEAAGTWDAAMEMVGPDGQPMSSKGVSVLSSALGGFWLVDDFRADIMGMKFHGHGMTGYDPIKGKYVSTWADSMSPNLMVMAGNYDDSGKVLTLTGTGIGPDGKLAPHRIVQTWKNANTNHFEMFVTGGDGKEAKVMTIVYTRRPAKAAPAKGK